MQPLTEVLKGLEKVGYVANELLGAQIALLLSQTGPGIRSMLMDGPPGSGKTALARAVATGLMADYVWTQAHPGSGPEDFLYDVNIVNILRSMAGDHGAVTKDEDVVHLGFLPTVFQMSQTSLVVALVDELDKASPKADSLFLAALQEATVHVPGVGYIKAEPNNLIMFFTKNQERQISEPLMRRNRRDYLTFPPRDLEVKIVTGQLEKKAAVTRKKPTLYTSNSREAIAVGLAGELINVANKMRQVDNIVKPPSPQEVTMAAHDIVRLTRDQMAVSKNHDMTLDNLLRHLVAYVTRNWMAAYPEDVDVYLKSTGSETNYVSRLIKEALVTASEEPLAGTAPPDVDVDF